MLISSFFEPVFSAFNNALYKGPYRKEKYALHNCRDFYAWGRGFKGDVVCTVSAVNGPAIEFWPDQVGFAYNGKDLESVFAQRSVFLSVAHDEYFLRVWLNERASDEEAATAIAAALHELFDMGEIIK